jgi:hypothetical protein
MLESQVETPEMKATSYSSMTRQALNRRNAAARRKLEALRERRSLRVAIADVWNKAGGA